MSELDLSIIIPAYKEEANLEFILPRVSAALKTLDCRSEILVVDTIEAMDGTQAVCEKNNTRYIRRESSNDYGSAIRTGISRAMGDWLVFMDADGSHTPEFIGELYKHRVGYDVVIASRYVKGGSTDNKPVLIVMSRMVNLAYSIVLGLHCRDVSNSFKLYLHQDLLNLNLTSQNFDIVEEILYKLKKKKGKLRILELPFSFKERQFGETKRDLGAFVLSYVKTLLRLRFGK